MREFGGSAMTKRNKITFNDETDVYRCLGRSNTLEFNHQTAKQMKKRPLKEEIKRKEERGGKLLTTLLILILIKL